MGDWEATEPGVRRKVLPPGKSLMMMLVAFDENARGSEHSHVHEQMSYCLEGSFEFVVGGKVSLLKAGENVSIPSGCVHGVKALERGLLLDCFTPLREDILGSDS